MSLLSIDTQSTPTYPKSTPAAPSGLPSSLWQRIAHFLPPAECARTIPSVCSPLKDIKPNQGILDLSNKPITGKELLSRVQKCQTPIETINISGCTELTDDDLKFLAEYPSLQTLDLRGCIGITQEGVEYLLLNTQITHLALPSLDMGESLLNDAVAKGNAELLKRVLSIGIPPEFSDSIEKGIMTPLYFATKSEDTECVKLLLQAGADPSTLYNDDELGRTVTAYEFAIGCQNPILASLYSVCPPTKLRVYSPYRSTEFRERSAKSFLKPLFKPRHSAKPFIKPLRIFAVKETARDLGFAIHIINQDHIFHAGSYSHKDGTISLHVRYQRKPKSCTSPLLHELSHKVIHKLGWTKAQKAEFFKEISEDIETLSQDNWQHCDPAIKDLFQGVDHYAKGKQFEEYLVRIPEIITLMSKKSKQLSPEDIHQQLKAAMPHLYAIYTEKFLPQLQEYNLRARH